MAQGAVKKPAKTGPKKPSQKVQRGNKVIKPKKASLIQGNKLNQKSTAGLAGRTEKMLAAKAGHLEMLKGGKKDRKEARAAKDAKDAKKAAQA